jgi:hypothetical protein
MVQIGARILFSARSGSLEKYRTIIARNRTVYDPAFLVKLFIFK